MSDLALFADALNRLVQNKSLSLAEQLADDKGIIKLSEEQEGTSLRSVKLKNVPSNARIVKIDHFDLQGKFIRTDGEAPFGKRCDYLIIDPQHSKILLIELKLGTRGAGEKQQVVAQLKGGRAIVDYLVALLKHFDNSHLDIDPKFFRYLWISYRKESGGQKNASRANGRDINEPLRLRNGNAGTYDYLKVSR